MPLIHRMGPSVELELRTPGFFPAGRVVSMLGLNRLKNIIPIVLSERGAIRGRRARVWLSKLSPDVAERELAVVTTN